MAVSTSQLIPVLVRKFHVEDGQEIFFVVKDSEGDDSTKGISFKLEHAFDQSKVNGLVDVLRGTQGLNGVTLYAFTPDRERGSRALEQIACNLLPFQIRDAVWTDKEMHGHWGGRGTIHKVPEPPPEDGPGSFFSRRKKD